MTIVPRFPHIAPASLAGEDSVDIQAYIFRDTGRHQVRIDLRNGKAEPVAARGTPYALTVSVWRASRAKDDCHIDSWSDYATSWANSAPQPVAVIQAGTASYEILLPDIVKALDARAAALAGQERIVRIFTTDVLGLRWEARWAEAVSTALLGGWADPLHVGRPLMPAALGVLQAEARVIHRQLTPLWRRRTNGARILLLDTPLGDDLTLYDVVAGSPDPQETAAVAEPADVRLIRILNALQPLEREVALARTYPGVATWTEAALYLGADDPVAFGERVRRKLKRLGQQHTDRARAVAARGTQ